VSLGYDAKREKRPARLVRNFHPQFRTSFNGMVQVAKYFTGGSCGFQLNRTDVGKLDPVVVVRCVVPMANAKKVFSAFLSLLRSCTAGWFLEGRITGCLFKTAHS
jgi:hypothetical protein